MTANYDRLVVHPDNPDVVYVGGTGWVNATIYKTTDGGSTWTNVVRRGDGGNTEDGWITFWGPDVAVPQHVAVRSRDALLRDLGEGPQDVRWGRALAANLHADAGGWAVSGDRAGDDLRRRRGGPPAATPSVSTSATWDIGLLISEDGGQSFRRCVQGITPRGDAERLLHDRLRSGRRRALLGQLRQPHERHRRRVPRRRRHVEHGGHAEARACPTCPTACCTRTPPGDWRPSPTSRAFMSAKTADAPGSRAIAVCPIWTCETSSSIPGSRPVGGARWATTGPVPARCIAATTRAAPGGQISRDLAGGRRAAARARPERFPASLPGRSRPLYGRAHLSGGRLSQRQWRPQCGGTSSRTTSFKDWRWTRTMPTSSTLDSSTTRTTTSRPATESG